MKYWSLLFGLVVHVTATAGLPIEVEQALAQADISQADVSVYVQQVDAVSPVIAHRASVAMNPASVMKLVTTQVALDELGPTYRWKTEAYRHGQLSDGVLKGDLIIKGFGDPSFKTAEFWRLLQSLRQAGLREIQGDLVIDKSYFSSSVESSVSFDEEIWRAYNAMPSAFLVNGRHTSLKFSITNQVVNVVQEFDLPQVKIINNMRPKTGQCGDWRNAMQYQVTSAPGGAVITLEGAYAADCGTRYLELSALNDTQYAFYTFKKLWEMLGGKFTGSLKVNPVPTTAILLETQLSAPLAELIRDINKWSNNLMARQLLLTLAAEKTMTPATAWQGERIVKESLASHGLVFPELVIENGSGLSRIERISTEHLGQLLVHAYRQSTMPEFMASLPILGLDGTVKMRLNHTKAQGQAHLKTGSLNDVTTIAGYVLTANHQRYVVVMFVNGPRAAQARSSQDVLINHIIN